MHRTFLGDFLGVRVIGIWLPWAFHLHVLDISNDNPRYQHSLEAQLCLSQHDVARAAPSVELTPACLGSRPLVLQPTKMLCKAIDLSKCGRSATIDGVTATLPIGGIVNHRLFRS